MTIRAGDIMIKYSDGSFVNKIIQVGQWFSKGSSKFTHAGIAASSNSIIEMDGQGLQEHSLTAENARIRYDVFRCKNELVGTGASEAGKLMLGFGSGAVGRGDEARIAYSKGGAFTSIARRSQLTNNDKINLILDRMLNENIEYYFCSGHVVMCYIIAMQQMDAMRESAFPTPKAQAVFGLDDACFNPSYLHKHLSNSNYFRRIGEYRGGRPISR